jgi:ornithine carbamoyltransferase
MTPGAVRHLISSADLGAEEVFHLFRLAAELKAGQKAGHLSAPLAGRCLALLFEKPSLRTRVTFEVGVVQLGGRAVYLTANEVGLGTRESVPDVARNLSLWVDGIVARVHRHQDVTTLARHASVPVFNGLSDHEHPCQALGDFFTLWERGLDPGRLHLAWIGDGNNVCHSLMLMGAALGARLTVACPAGYEPAGAVQAAVRQLGARFAVTRDPGEAAEGADVLYTDVWASMGQEAEREERRRIFRDYRIDGALLRRARPSAVVMHCLPAHRGEEITDEVLDGPQSIVLDQAENRLHAQKAVIREFIGER